MTVSKSPARKSGPDELTEEQEMELTSDLAAVLAETMEVSAFDSVEAKRGAWEVHGERLTREYMADNPGKRPPGWWAYEAPRDRPAFAEDRPEGAPRDLPNEAAWLLELGELTEEERGRCGPPNPAERAAIKEAENSDSSGISPD